MIVRITSKPSEDLSAVDRMIANGRIGDGIGDIPKFSVWEWLGGKVSDITVSNTVDWIADITPALPVLAVVCVSVYFLINMVSKSGAKWGAVATFIYGIYVIK